MLILGKFESFLQEEKHDVLQLLLLYLAFFLIIYCIPKTFESFIKATFCNINFISNGEV